jgi:hypothetical protein
VPKICRRKRTEAFNFSSAESFKILLSDNSSRDVTTTFLRNRNKLVTPYCRVKNSIIVEIVASIIIEISIY